MKLCTLCQLNKSKTDFYKDCNRKDGLGPWCKECCTKHNKKSYSKNRESRIKKACEYQQADNRRNSYLIKKYNITLQQYLDRFKQQNESCKLCGKHQSNFKRRFAVDHCHETGIVRGLLCFPCNKFLISKINSSNARAIIQYLLNAYPELLSGNSK